MTCGVIFMFLNVCNVLYQYKYRHIAHTDPCLLNRQSKARLPTNGYRRMLVRQLQLRRLHGHGKDTLVHVIYIFIQTQ